MHQQANSIGSRGAIAQYQGNRCYNQTHKSNYRAEFPKLADGEDGLLKIAA